MVGNVAIYLAFILSIIGALLYLVNIIYPKKELIPYARYSFYIKTTALAVASVYLLWGLLAHKFQYYYVYAHTSTDLPLEYLISAFWAGQEGTFLLWAFLAALTGLALIKWEKEYESPVMFFLLAGQAFLLLFLVVHNPFRLMSGIPVEGYGLNPLLMDPWMVIHPPIIFVGYAALLLPCAYAIGGLWKKDYQGWASRALPWAVAGWFFLGAGIIIGGYWAYKVLGWGGYWGWDPVENASLVPWLTCTALVHGILVQKARGLNLRSNIVLAIITFVLIIYATFLTRSGILADFSVHAFTETGLNPYMLAFMLFFFIIGMGLFLARYRDIPSDSVDEIWYSKVSTFSYTILLLSLSAIIISIGTSSPIITGFIGSPASVDTSFYNLTNAPIAVLLALVLAICPLVKWRNNENVKLWTRLKVPTLLTVLGLVITVIFGVYSPLKLLFLGSAYLALATNSFALYNALKRGIKNSGGYLAHVGLALMLVGILTSSTLDHSHVISLKHNETGEALGYSFTYLGSGVSDENEVQELQVKKGDSSFIATPRMYYTGEEPDTRLMREPYIARGLFSDLYISPLEERLEKPGTNLTLVEGDSIRTMGYDIKFLEFYMDSHDQAGKVQVGAVLEVEKEGNKVEIMPAMLMEGKETEHLPQDLPGEESQVFLEAVDADQGKVMIRIAEKDAPPPEAIFIIEVSNKPLISVLYLGSIFLMVGTLLACWRRFSNYSS